MKNRIIIGIVLLITFLVYWPTLKSSFVLWDDDVHLLNNTSVRGLDKEHLAAMFTETVNKIYIPLTTLSFAVEYRYFGYNPFVYHLNNVILHLFITLFIFILGLRLGLKEWGAGIAALIFGVHPMHVESVAWVTERKDVLYAFFYMLALLSYIKFLDPVPSKQGLRFTYKYFYLVLTFVFGVLSMLAKPMALSLPLILILLDWFLGRGFNKRSIAEKLPFFLALGGLAWLTYTKTSEHLQNNPLEAVMIWSWTFIFYIRQFIFPFILLLIYKLPYPIELTNLEYAGSMLILIIMVWALIRYRWNKGFIFAFLFYIFSIFFVLRFDDVTKLLGPGIVSDRYMYLPSVGFCILLGMGFEQCLNSNRTIKFPLKIMTIGIGAILTLWFGFKTYQQCLAWKDSVSLWGHQLKYIPSDYLALNNYAGALRDLNEYKEAEQEYKKIVAFKAQGESVDSSNPLVQKATQKVEELIALYQKAIQANSDYLEPVYNLGRLYHDLGEADKALEWYLKSLALQPLDRDTNFSIAKLYAEKGLPDRAIEVYEKLVKNNPDNEDVLTNVILAYIKAIRDYSSDTKYQNALNEAFDQYITFINRQGQSAVAYFNLGYLYGEAGSWEQAVSAYRMALDINPDHANAMNNLANIYMKNGQLKEALELFLKAVQKEPGKSDIYINIGIIYNKFGDIAKAKEYFQRSISKNAQNSRAYFNLAYLEENGGDKQKAIDLYKKSLDLDPEQPEASYNMGNVYAGLGQQKEAVESYLKAVTIDSDHLNAWINLSVLSFHLKDFKAAARYLDEAVLLGYEAPEGFVKALEPYRGVK